MYYIKSTMHYPWNAIPVLEVSAIPPLAKPVPGNSLISKCAKNRENQKGTPSRFSSMMSFLPSVASHITHCDDGRTSVSVHVLQITCEHGRITEGTVPIQL